MAARFTCRVLCLAAVVSIQQWATDSASADDVYYYSGPSYSAPNFHDPMPGYIVAPRMQRYAPAYVVSEPVVVYRPSTIVYAPVVVPPPLAFTPPPRVSRYYVREKFRSRPGKYKYKQKVYSPYRLGSIYEYEVEYDHGRIKIKEDFD